MDIFRRPTLITVIVLLIPLLLMLFGVRLYDPGSGYEQLNWDWADFLVIGALVFIASLSFEFLASTVKRQHRMLMGVAVLAIALWLWAEMAVGVFTNWGS